jgi:outer membrane receptor protein involved in Fe transport
MYGQAPYIVNGILSYKSDSLGFVITASYNVQGPRLVIAGAIKGRPDVYELPRQSVDIKASKKLGDHFTASLTIRDLLNAPVRRSYDLPDGWVDFDNFRYGTNYMLSLAYKF